MPISKPTLFAAGILAATVASFLAVPASADDAANPRFGPAESSVVHWQPFGPEAFARARTDNKPIYMLVGSSLNELSRSTLKSLEATETAGYFNAHFICVVVDRDEQPGVAAAAQQYLRAVKQMAGWPANLWLTPDGQPYDGANYLPAGEEWGKKSLIEIARIDGETWLHDATGCRRAAKEAGNTMRLALAVHGGLDPARLKAALDDGAQGWRTQYDAVHGGFGDPPRYPQPELVRFFLNRGGADRDMARAALRAIAASALRDPLDGGFFHYLQDAEGRLPYPQKYLSDQARIALAYLDADRLSPDPAFVEAARGALDYALGRLARPDGTLVSAEDGTREGSENHFVWTAAEVAQALGAEAAPFDAAYAIAPTGNIPTDADPSGQFTGKNILRRAAPRGSAAAEAQLSRDCAALLARRDRRPALVQDRRAAADAHGLLLAALARAAEQFGDARYRDAAVRLGTIARAAFIDTDGTVHHFAGDPHGLASPGDYTALALGYRELDHLEGNGTGALVVDRLLRQGGSLFLEKPAGVYAAGTVPPLPGVFVRAPAYLLADGAPSPEALALLAQPDAETAHALERGLVQRLADSDVSYGDALFALSQAP